MSEAGQISEAEFLQIEEFISRTARGRAFLREHNRRAQAVMADEVRNLVAELRDLWRQQTEATNLVNRIAVLRHELQDMSASISHARREIAAIKPAGEGKDRIVTATNELDAIIVSTERASTDILSSAERILDQVGRLRSGTGVPDLADVVEGEVMNIFTACSFQDLTGQRTTKVINVLRYIEQRIGALITLWGVSPEDGRDAPPAQSDLRPDAHLLHGPSLDGMDQDQVDLLLSGKAPPRPASPEAASPGGAERGRAASAAASATEPTTAPAARSAGEEALPALDQSAIDALFG